MGDVTKPDYEAAAQVFRTAGYTNKGIRVLLDQAVDAAVGQPDYEAATLVMWKLPPSDEWSSEDLIRYTEQVVDAALTGRVS